MSSLRTNSIDKRRLSPRDRNEYRGGSRETALARTRAYKGQLAMESKRRPNTTDSYSSGGDYLGDFKPGIDTQVQRNRERGAQLKRSRQLRPSRIVANEEGT